MSSTLSIALVIVLAVISLPKWPFNKTWGYFPLGFFTGMLTVMLILMLARVGGS